MNICGVLTNTQSLCKNPRCIPTSSEGYQLSRPGDLIDPTGAVSSLYLEDENIFPTGAGFLRPERLVALKKLGMVDSLLTWKGICERAMFIAALATHDNDKALQMSKNLLKYLNDNMCKLSPPSPTQRKQLSQISFLPVMAKPTEYSLPWKGSEEGVQKFLSAEELVRKDSIFLLGSVHPVLDESPETGCDRVGKDVAKLLGFTSHRATVHNVLLQLYYAVEGLVTHDAANRECIRNICLAVYQFLQERINTVDKQVIQDLLSGKPWIFVESKFVTSNQVAFSWNNNGAPFLYCLPEDFTLKFRDLFRALGVQESFSGEDMIDALFVLEERKQGQPLTSQEFKTVKGLPGGDRDDE